MRRGTVSSVSSSRVEFTLHEELGQDLDESAHLLISVFKFDRFEWAVEKVTELGATRITPVIAHHTDVHLARAAVKRVERWRRIAREAAQQSRRPRIPTIDDPCKLGDGLCSFVSGSRLVLAESEREASLADFLYSSAVQSPLVIAVGPEGGWTPQELSDFSGSGWKSVSLGRRILRAETAVITAMALVGGRFC